MNACWTGCSVPPAASPAAVVIAAPSYATARARQDSTRSLSSSTVQAPHWPWSQPFFGLVLPSRSRSASSRLVRVSIVSRRLLPSTCNVISAWTALGTEAARGESSFTSGPFAVSVRRHVLIPLTGCPGRALLPRTGRPKPGSEPPPASTSPGAGPGRGRRLGLSRCKSLRIPDTAASRRWLGKMNAGFGPALSPGAPEVPQQPADGGGPGGGGSLDLGEPDREEQCDPVEQVGEPDGRSCQFEALNSDRQDGHRDEGAQHVEAAAPELGRSQESGGERREQVGIGDRRVAGRQLGAFENSCDRGDDTAADGCEQDDPGGTHAGQPGCLGIAASGVHAPARPRPFQEVPDEYGDEREDVHGIGDAEKRVGGDRLEAGPEVQDLLAARQPGDDGQEHRAHAGRGDEGANAGAHDQQADGQADRGSGQHGQADGQGNGKAVTGQ